MDLRPISVRLNRYFILSEVFRVVLESKKPPYKYYTMYNTYKVQYKNLALRKKNDDFKIT